MKTLAIAAIIGCLFLACGCRTDGSAQSRSGRLVILIATYGAEPGNTIDVTEELRILARNGPIHLHPQWALGVDPAYGKTKRVAVAYRCNGKIDVVTADQYQEFQIPAPCFY
jgi:hypothetical protein